MKRSHYHDYLNELTTGNSYSIFIDDTGSPGLNDTPENFDPNRQSWVAVVVSPDLLPEVLDQFTKALDELKKQTDAKEFHFTEIYQGRKEFKNVDLHIRFALIEFMASLFSSYRFPVVSRL
jgi:hypothetical protein